MDRVFPSLRPGDTQGAPLDDLDEARLQHEGMKKHALPLVDPGPADLSIVYVLREPSYDVVVNAEHLLTWAIDAQTLRDAAMANLRAWSATAPWSDELDGQRRLLSRPTPATAATPRGSCCRRSAGTSRASAAGRRGCSIALPDRDLLIAGSLHPGDGEFAEQFAAFVRDLIDGAHEPIERGLFELVGDDFELVQYGR